MSNLLKIALSQYGVKEITGDKHNQTIIDYAHDVGEDWVNDDETPWCSLFVKWCVWKAGFGILGKANARSWLKEGELTTEPETGDLVIFKRGSSSWKGHVGFYINYEGKELVRVLGGNQSNEVRISLYNSAKILGFVKLKRIL